MAIFPNELSFHIYVFVAVVVSIVFLYLLGEIHGSRIKKTAGKEGGDMVSDILAGLFAGAFWPFLLFLLIIAVVLWIPWEIGRRVGMNEKAKNGKVD